MLQQLWIICKVSNRRVFIRGGAIILGILPLFWGPLYCSTTHVSTSNSYDAKKRGEKLSEDGYFGQLSQQDPAFGETDPEAEGQMVETAGDNCPPCAGDATAASQNGDGFQEIGLASWYGPNFEGKQTASGEVFDSRKLTAAHKTIPLGSIVLVRNLENDREILVKINDRGPFVKGRIIDVSEYGSELLGYKQQGLTQVGIRIVRRAKSGEARSGETRVGKVSDGPEVTQGYLRPNSRWGRGEGRDADISPALERLSRREFNSAAIPQEGFREFYSVQVGIFAAVKNAHSMESYLENYGHPIEVKRRGAMYAVSIGRFSNRYRADRLAAQLAADGYSAFVTEPD